MLSRLSARSPVILRVFLTGVSALAAVCFASAFTRAPALPSAVSSPVQPALNGRAFAAYRAAAATGTVTVQKGDTLSGISARVCGTAADWSGLFAANRAVLGNPDVIEVGQRLAVSCTDPGYTWPKPPAPVVHADAVTVPVQRAPAASYSGVLTAAQVGTLWLEAGGPAWAEAHAEEIAYCESGYNTGAYNPSGATGLWQILGSVVPGNLDDPLVNAENAVAKFKASGDTFAQWVCT
jgi:LysM repeat protein